MGGAEWWKPAGGKHGAASTVRLALSRSPVAPRGCARQQEEPMRTWTLAGAFAAGHIHGWTPGWEQELRFHQLELTGHAAQLEADYRLLREEFGLTQFRDGAFLNRTFRGPGEYDWS